MRILLFFNLKGGVAKSITSVAVAHILATVHGKRVLLWDNDKQGNPSKMLGLHSYDRKSAADVLTERNIDMLKVIQPTAYENLHLIPANMKLVEANMIVMMDQTRPQQTRYAKAIQSIQDEYDFIIFDNAPDINMYTVNALVAASEVVIPIKIDKYSFDGLKELTQQIEYTKEELNPNLQIGGYLITQFYNSEYTQKEEKKLRNTAKYPVYKIKVRRTPKVDESTFEEKPILEYSKTCSAARDYMKFVEELLSE